MCKLTHKGHQQYAKGDGIAFADYLRREWPAIKNRCVGRVEHSKRQDWICEASWKFDFNALRKPALRGVCALLCLHVEVSI
jgi:hypothetical protein